ncbi:MAG: hypothetical protein Q4G08_00290 [Capnocytophaga sp.]|nr:hypothetical protein [Capnocytophaga sp.]
MLNETISIHAYLPHRKPMLMVDTILEINENEVVTEFLVTEDCIFAHGGFLSESGLIENAAQTCSAIVGRSILSDGNGGVRNGMKTIGFISGIKQLAIYRKPAANEIIITEASLISKFDTEEYCICAMKCRTLSQGKTLLEADINLFIKKEK